MLGLAELRQVSQRCIEWLRMSLFLVQLVLDQLHVGVALLATIHGVDRRLQLPGVPLGLPASGMRLGLDRSGRLRVINTDNLEVAGIGSGEVSVANFLGSADSQLVLDGAANTWRGEVERAQYKLPGLAGSYLARPGTAPARWSVVSPGHRLQNPAVYGSPGGHPPPRGAGMKVDATGWGLTLPGATPALDCGGDGHSEIAGTFSPPRARP